MRQITSIGEILFDFYDGQKKLGGAPFNFFYHIINLTGGGNFISRIGDDHLGKDILEFFKFFLSRSVHRLYYHHFRGILQKFRM